MRMASAIALSRVGCVSANVTHRFHRSTPQQSQIPVGVSGSPSWVHPSYAMSRNT
ncbi:hypothetical protein K9N68_38385 (plasmid) [Kovacikia minuta CCNUW1]|uniref:hypothetical protein n=1 Tax=Kovacikia minuta TaxID=2931930 RepID=UPI001CCA1019|nr:hypothetical protein [Kovacikia minuta]UBF30060.1 hypothetical protein K9N68_38385 [Kovacikia minuta CCNUW1]